MPYVSESQIEQIEIIERTHLNIESAQIVRVINSRILTVFSDEKR